MKRHGLFLVTMLTLVFSALSMARAGWFDAARGRGHRAAQLHSQARAFDPMGSQAAWRSSRRAASSRSAMSASLWPMA